MHDGVEILHLLHPGTHEPADGRGADHPGLILTAQFLAEVDEGVAVGDELGHEIRRQRVGDEFVGEAGLAELAQQELDGDQERRLALNMADRRMS